MANRNVQSRGGEMGKRKRRVRVVPIIVTVLCVMVGMRWMASVWRDTRSADEQLAKIETARAVPDAENAAILYHELLRNPNAASLSYSEPNALKGRALNERLNEPWRSEDHPELASWIEEHQYIIDKLVEISRLEHCRFPLSIDIADTSTMDRGMPMRQWAFLVILAVNNDLAEGRLDDAMAKWRCLLQVANHLRQQPTTIDQLIDTGVAELTLKSIARFVVTGDASAEHLQRIEAMPLQLTDDWERHASEIRRIEQLTKQRLVEPLSLLDRLRFRVTSFRMKRSMRKTTGGWEGSPIEGPGSLYRRRLATARGLRLLIELRRAKNRTGRWPQNLDEIAPTVPARALIDPQNGGPFVYYRVSEGFWLYSAGPNGRDEYGRRRYGRDDWPIWPPPGGTRASQRERTDDK